MASPDAILQSFSAGMKRDFAREAMPQNALWNIIDILPDVIDSKARKRGGYEHVSQAMSAITAASATYIVAGIHAPFSDGDSNLCFDEDGFAFEIESATGSEAIGAAVATLDPVFYSDKVIVPHSAGTSAPKKITRSSGTHSVTALGGSPPAGRYAVIYKDVLWLASPSASADRIFFATAGNPEATWDTTNKYLDMSYPITGMGAMQNAVLVFGLGRTARVRGSIPPPDSDFIVDDPVFEVGCTDNRSITMYKDKLIWANAGGLYISDGAAMDDLTRICGMKQWWLDVMGGAAGAATGSSYDRASWSIVTEMLGDWLVYSIMNAGTEVDGGVIDMTKYAWFRCSNLDFVAGWRRPYPEEAFFGRRGASFVAKVSSFFQPAASNKNDGDGTAVLPQYETPYYLGNAGLKTMRRVFSTHDIRGATADNPYLTVSYIDSPEETTYTALAPTLTVTTAITRKHLPLNKSARGIAFKVAQTAASSDTRFYGLELESAEREGMK
jgi:hypothetical protein